MQENESGCFFSEHSVHAYLLLFPRYNDFLVENLRFAVFTHHGLVWGPRKVCFYYILANRHSCSTSAETQDRKCFSMQLILVVGNLDMINQICQLLSFCWKLLSA